MARSRNIKPGFFVNETMSDLEPLTRLLFIGLWTLADREGRLEDRPRRIHVSCLPYDKVNVDSCLNQLQTNGFITRYMVNNKPYIEVVNWRRHQNPHHKEVASLIPERPKEQDIKQKDSHAQSKHDSSMDHDQTKKNASCPTDSLNLIPDSLNPDTTCQKLQNEQKPIITIILANKSEYPIFEKSILEWAELFPGIDVTQTLRSIKAWNLSSPSKRKTKRGILRHITGWLTKEQDRRGGKNGEYSKDSKSGFRRGDQIGQEWIDETDAKLEKHIG